MANKEELIEFEGVVTETLPNTMFLFIGHSQPDDQIGKGQIIVNLFEFYKVKRM
jgi:hypothetical protein